jgi:uncharacterized membrane protein
MTKMIRSFQKNKKGIVLILIASISIALGQLLWKLCNSELNIYLVLGFVFYLVGAVFMIIAFQFGSLSVLHPMLSIGYVFSILLGFFFLQELLTVQKLFGIGLIMVGAILIGGGDHD